MIEKKTAGKGYQLVCDKNSVSQKVYLFPASSPVTKAPSTIVKEPIPGKTRDFKISVPVAVALIKHTFALSNAVWPWSPQSLTMRQIKNVFVPQNVNAKIIP